MGVRRASAGQRFGSPSAPMQEKAGRLMSRRSMTRGAIILAALSASATVLGVVRDIVVVRRLGYGPASDSYFLYTTAPGLYFAVAGLSAYVPLSIRHPSAARRVLLAAAVAATLLTIAVNLRPLVADPSTQIPVTGSLVASFWAMSALFVRWREATILGSVWRIGLYQNVANCIVLAVVAMPFANGPVATMAFAASIPIGMLVCLPKDRPVENSEGLKKAAWVYLIACSAYTAYVLGDRTVGVLLGNGTNTALVLAAKAANFPIGVLGIAVATSTFMSIVSRDPSTQQNATGPKALGVAAANPVLTALLCTAFGAALAATGYIGAGLYVQVAGGGHADAHRLAPILAAYLGLTPFAILQAVAVQDALAHQHFDRYSRSVVVFYCPYVIACVTAVVTGLAAMAPVGLLLAFVAQTIYLSHSKAAAPILQ